MYVGLGDNLWCLGYIEVLYVIVMYIVGNCNIIEEFVGLSMEGYVG